ncbi:ROK family transcriptional regulator [Arthrobacter sp. EH-1B-1]|uniref:ROK family transcriptional regulator n=1 Tax=Arthrobacter vasquezii TaxID=2977629 RepID=A0ABT6CWZ9_9MICC|nr:ROK family transcriptional regulator [Arthrobacter vasquezii]MDF9278614.1 ROK family transcriptional regulator [Arthrobacter vasquezii]
MTSPSQDERIRRTVAGTNLGNNRDSTRQHNLSTVLRLVHSMAGVSRAQLTRATGLNRSTIAALVGELVQLGLVVESNLDLAQQHGRPSIMIEPSRGALALSVNPDIDVVSVALVSLGGHIVNPVRFHTVRAPSVPEVVNIVKAVYSGMRTSLPAGHRIMGVGLAIPGLVDPVDGTVIEAPHLGWRDEPLAALLSDALKLPVIAANDAVVGARAQATFGAGRDVSDLVYLYGGASGIGGGVISGGRLISGATGFAGQLGHTHVRSGGAACTCGSSGCLEAEVTREELIAAVGLPAGETENLEEAVMEKLQQEGSQALRDIIERQVQLLAVGLKSVVNLLNPSMIVLGGFLRILDRAAPDALSEALRAPGTRGPRERVAIELAPLGEDPILVGAAELAFEPLIRNPAGFLRFHDDDADVPLSFA